MKSGKWAKIARSIAGLTLAAGFVALTAGCQGYDIYIVPKDPDASQTEPNKDLTDPEQKDPATPNVPDYTKYSQLLQDVLKSDYYNGLIGELNQNLKDKINAGNFDADFNLFESIPYRFLESKGEDIKNIKMNNVRASTEQYVLDSDKNTLFNKINLTYQNDDGNIMKQYLIKYHISDQEYDDLKMLFKGNYYQAAMFVQELDNQRDAELVNEFAIDENTYKGLLKIVNEARSIDETFNGKYKNKIDSLIVTTIKPYPDTYYSAYYLTYQIFTKGNNNNISSRETFNCVVLHNGAIIDNGVYTAKDDTNIQVVELTDITQPIEITWFSMPTNTNKTKDFIKK